MERSEQIGDMIAALAKAQAEFTPALKENEAKIKGTSKAGAAYEYGYKYADLAANLGAVRPALNKHGIAIMHFNESDLERQVASVTCSMHLGEQFIAISAEAPAVGQNGFNVQSLGAVWTYLRRYTLQALCGLATEDDDGNSLVVYNKHDPENDAEDNRLPPIPATAAHPEDESQDVPTPGSADAHGSDAISEGKARRFWAIAKSTNKTDVEIKSALNNSGLSDIKTCPWKGKLYDDLIEWAGKR